jgi:translation initiation factor IF-3
VNYRIRVPEVRVIGPDGAQLGVLPTREALALAQEQGLDLLEVAPTAQPPVCKILDYGKYKFDESKKAKATRQKAHAMEVKGIRMRPGMEAHDFKVRLEATQRFLSEKHKVQVTLIFRGREAAHAEIGRALLQRLADEVSAIGQIERAPLLEGRRMIMVLAPK